MQGQAEAGDRRPRAWGTSVSKALSALTFVLILVAVSVQCVMHFGWFAGALIGWFLAPVAAVAGSMLFLLWTVPMRGPDQLSLRRRRSQPRIVADESTHRRTVSVVMPVYNAHEYLTRSLPPLIEMLRRGEVAEVLVVDDGSTDGSADYAASLGARVLSSGGRLGPGAARNVAAAQALGELLWFIDADVVVHDTAGAHVRTAFAEPGVVAVFGSYDDTPSAPNFGSQYKNLVHHHYHQQADAFASTFWSGCGAVDKRAFLAVGGFDAAKFNRPSIEDVDLGYRLRAAGGQIRLERRLLSTHLKHWTVPELVKTDIFRRALPWARLMLRRSEVLDDLNVGVPERLRAALAGLTVLALAGILVGVMPAWVLAPLLLTLLTANWDLFRVFQRNQGVVFGVAALAFHQVYYLYSAATFVWCWLESKVAKPEPRRELAAPPPAAVAPPKAA